jgi:hypothetical protein
MPTMAMHMKPSISAIGNRVSRLIGACMRGQQKRVLRPSVVRVFSGEIPRCGANDGNAGDVIFLGRRCDYPLRIRAPGENPRPLWSWRRWRLLRHDFLRGVGVELRFP